nr:BEM46 family protein [Cryptococcus depauperatus CBS 7855]
MTAVSAFTIAKYAFGASVVGATLCAGCLWYFQRHLIYPSGIPQGSRQVVPKPIEVGCPYEDVTLTCPDGIKIKAYVMLARRKPLTTDEIRHLSKDERKERAKKEVEAWAQEMGDEKAIKAHLFYHAKSRPTVVIFHANAGNMGHRIPLARHFNVDFGCNVFMLSYRGYGHSEGHPSEAGLKIDIQTAMKYIQVHPILGSTKIVVYGQSLGGSACLYAASKHRDIVAGVIVENTFLSLQTLIPLVLPQLPKILLPILLTEHWDAHDTMPNIPSTTPVLFLAGRRDELVKPSQMIALRGLRAEGRTRWRDFDSEHNDTCVQPEYWEEIGKWLREEVEEKGKVE